MKKLITLLIISIFATPCFSAPVVSTVGTVSNGATFTVTGSGFGTRTRATPLIFDRFEDGVPAGTSIETQGVWQKGSTADVKYQSANQRTSTSDSNILVTMDYDSGTWGGTWMKDILPNTKTKKIVSFWTYLEKPLRDSTSDAAQIKYFRTETGSSHGDYMSVVNQLFIGTDSSLTAHQQQLGFYPIYGAFWDRVAQWNKWRRYTLIIEESTQGVDDGYFSARIDGSTFFREKTNQVTNTSQYPLYQRWVKFGYDAANSAALIARTMWDDVYVDDNWNRVEICNASNYEASTVCEIQSSISWSSTSATLQGNPGSFSVGSDVFLYVIDGDNVPSAGEPITIGSSGTDTTPPILSSTFPANGSIDVALNQNQNVYFDEPVDCATLTLTISNGTKGTTFCSGSSASFPVTGQVNSTSTTITVASGLEDTSGNPTTSAFTSTYTTVAAGESCDVSHLSLCPTKVLCEGVGGYFTSLEAIECSSQTPTERGYYEWGGMVYDVPAPSDIEGSNLVTNDSSDWTFYSSAMVGDKGFNLISGSGAAYFDILEADTAYIVVRNVFSVANQHKVYLDPVNLYSSELGTVITRVTTGPEPMTYHWLFFGTEADNTAYIGDIGLYKVRTGAPPMISKSTGVPMIFKSSGNPAIFE